MVPRSTVDLNKLQGRFQELILVFLGVLLSALMMCTFTVNAMPDQFALNTGMMFGAMLDAGDGARRHEGGTPGRK